MGQLANEIDSEINEEQSKNEELTKAIVKLFDELDGYKGFVADAWDLFHSGQRYLTVRVNNGNVILGCVSRNEQDIVTSEEQAKAFIKMAVKSLVRDQC